jgi:hypothetical protein
MKPAGIKPGTELDQAHLPWIGLRHRFHALLDIVMPGLEFADELIQPQ